MKQVFKKGLSLFGVLVMLLTMIPMGLISVSAADETFDLPDGYTLQAISNEEELAAIKTGSSASKVYYYLTKDIDVTSATFGIGKHENTDAFFDILDGNGFAINFVGPDGNGVALSGSGTWNGGLFIGLNGDAVVKNLTLNGAITSTAQSSGVLTGQMMSGTIDRCVNNVDMKVGNKNHIGGFAGRVKEGVIVNCMNYGDIAGTNHVGGFIGGVSYPDDMTDSEKEAGVVKVVVANCANFGSVTGTDKIGGIVGLAAKDKSYRIDNCYNVGNIPLATASANTTGAIVCSAWSHAVITNNCYALESSCEKMLAATTKMTQADMQAASFADTLNANVAAGISYQKTVGGNAITLPLVSWKANTGDYPTIPMVTPILPKEDMSQEEQFEKIRQGLVEYFLQNDTFDDGATAGTCYTSKAGDYLAIQNADGSWSDVDYYCTQSAANGGVWEPYLVLDRMQAMAMAYANEKGEWYRDPDMLQGVENAFTYWASIRDANPEKDDYEGPWSTNWWENGNGVQLRFSRIGVVLKDVLSDFAKNVILRKLDLNGSTGSGQNALWQTQNALYRALVADDVVQFKKVVDNNLAVNLRFGGLNDEAVQVDNSFHAHGDELYTNGYGRCLFRDMAFWIDTLAGTDFAMPQNVIDLMADYMLGGTRWMIRGNLLEIANGYTGGSASAYIEPLERMIKNDPKNAAEYQKVLDSITGKSGTTYNGSNGNHYMWTSDLMAHQREEYGLNVRMIDKLMKSAEWRATWPSAAKETGNLIFWTADATSSVMIDGDEYLSVYPTYDWRHIPGVTSPFSLATMYGFDNGNADAWAVSTGEYGVTAYVYNKHDGTNKRTSGKVGFFLFDDVYVSLGSGIGSNHPSAIHTTINQTKSGEDVSVDGSDVALGTDDVIYNAEYVYNNKIGYIFPEKTEVHVSNLNHFSKEYPSVYGLGYAQDGTEIKREDTGVSTFSLWIDHGVTPSKQSFAYIVMPNATEAEVAAYAKENPLTIIANTENVQAVRHEELKQTQINFYAASSLEYAEGKTISVDAPCSLILDESGEETVIYEAVSNTQNAKTVKVTIKSGNDTTVTTFCSLEEPYAGKTMMQIEGGDTAIQAGSSSVGHSIGKAFDKNLETYWSTTENDTWISYDLKEITYVGDMTIHWGNEYATSYELQYSEDGINWTTSYTQLNGKGGTEVVPYHSVGRYWRLVCKGSSSNGYTIKEISFKDSKNIALKKDVTAGYENADAMYVTNVNDGNVKTRWGGQRSTHTNWVIVDLGSIVRLDGVRVLWETAYSSEYSIDISQDNITWNTIKNVTCTGGSVQTALPTGTTGRYVRIQGIKAALHQYGMSIWELEVYGEMEMEGDNVAIGMQATDSASNTVTQVTDEDDTTLWSSDKAADSLTFKFDEPHHIDTLAVTFGDRYATDYVWQISADGATWNDVVTVTGASGNTDPVSIDMNAQYVRLALNKSVSNGYDVAEIAIVGVPVSEMIVDKTALKNAIGRIVRTDVYTKDSYTAYKDALTAASNIYAAEKATQKQVNKALDALNDAYKGLTFRYLGEVLGTVKGQTATAGSRQTLQVNWTAFENPVDLSGEDLDKVYLFFTIDISTENDSTGKFTSGRILLRSPNAPTENNAWVASHEKIISDGRTVLYFPVSEMTNQTGTMDWSQVVTFRFYIDSMNQLEGNKTAVLSDVQLIRTNEPDRVKVACVGDSITAGVGASASFNNYVSLLQNKLGNNYYVQNFGNSGKTLLKDGAGNNGYVLTDTYKNSIAFEPDVVTIMLGTNDSKDDNWNTMSDKYEQELRDLITTYRNLPSKPLVILATSPTAYNRNWSINDAVITGEIAPIQRKVAEEMGCPLIETNANTKGMGDKFADGIHPNDAGYVVLANLFAEGITDASTRIYSFEVNGETAVIDEEKSTITLTLPANTDLTSITPEMNLMASAMVTPSGNVDYTNPVTLTVTAPDRLNTREYVVTITKDTQTPVVDKSALNEALEGVITDLNGYTAASAEAYTKAVTDAKAIADKADATQDEVDQAIKALTDAKNALKAITLGDVNFSGSVSAEDALFALQAATNKVELTADQTVAADVDKKDGVTASDALLILQFSTKKIGSF